MTQAAIQPQWRRGMPVLDFHRVTNPNVVKLNRRMDRVNVIPPKIQPVRKQKRAQVAQQTRRSIEIELAPEPAMTHELPSHIRAAIQDAASVITLKQPPVSNLQKVQVTPAIMLEKHSSKFDPLFWFTLLVAGVLAVVSAYFSVTGLTRIFPGAAVAIVVMGSAMECGKFAGVTWLSRHWTAIRIPTRLVVVGLVSVVAIINALGVFGQLSAAHLDPHTDAMAATSVRAAGSNADIEAQEKLIRDYDRRIGQIDGAVEEATKRGRTTSALDIASAQKAGRQILVTDRATAEKELRGLRETKARIAGDEQRANADIGVLQYAATIFGIDRERMISWLILAMVLSCDPLSIALVCATGQRRRA